MRRTINKMIIISGLLCAGFASCGENEDVQPQEQTYEYSFTGSTRAGSDGSPEHADTYRVMAYSKIGNKIITSTNQLGTYAYDLKGDYTGSSTVGSIIPVAVSTTTYQTPLVDGKLVKAGANGLHLTAGDYYVSMIHPCVPVYTTSGLGYLAVFERADKIYASQPLDKNGDGTADDSFEINVSSNAQKHDVTGVVMHPLMSAIKVYFYSHFYAESDPDHDVPISTSFTVDVIKLVNAGNNGWYNPREEMVYPNYNYNSKTVYSKDLIVSGTQNEEKLITADSSDPIMTKDGKTATAMYMVDNVSVFPSDYRGSDMGGSVYVIPMTLRVELKDAADQYNRVSIPVSLKIERNKLYTFYINVTSSQIIINYSVGGWVEKTSDYTVVGDPDVIEYKTIDISWTNSGNWTNSGGDTQVIDNN
ncbi:MAG: hypothetical protein LBT43_12270 [Prevotella sp.]|nr:hypothetical protein [Prevotella sp.]MDR2001457.1 hypothetical protein [Prevotella sp.]